MLVLVVVVIVVASAGALLRRRRLRSKLAGPTGDRPFLQRKPSKD